jgi:hypothetical protein
MSPIVAENHQTPGNPIELFRFALTVQSRALSIRVSTGMAHVGGRRRRTDRSERRNSDRSRARCLLVGLVTQEVRHGQQATRKVVRLV